MNLEFIFVMQDGTEVNVQGEFDYVDGCDCKEDDGHVHIQDIRFTSLIDELGNNVFLEPYDIVALESVAEDEAYHMLEMA